MCLGNSTPSYAKEDPNIKYNNGNIFDPKPELELQTNEGKNNNNNDNNKSNTPAPIKAPTNNKELAAQMESGLNRTYFVPRIKYKVKNFFK